MKKIDFKKEMKHLYNSSPRHVVLVDVPIMKFFKIDGEGDPNTSERFAQAVEALYSLSYTIKYSIKKSGVLDYGVMPLEGLWWCDEMDEFSARSKDDWKWTVMIMQPDIVTDEIVGRALEEVKAKKNLPLLDSVRFETYDEGACAQIMHIGPYASEAPTIQLLHSFIKMQNQKRRGLHHEIYIGDPRKSAPEKLKTILRQPLQ